MTPKATEPMTDERREFLRIFFEVQDHTRVDEIEAELWREMERLRLALLIAEHNYKRRAERIAELEAELAKRP